MHVCMPHSSSRGKRWTESCHRLPALPTVGNTTRAGIAEWLQWTLCTRMNGHSKDSLNYYYLWLCLPLLLSANIMIQSLPPPIVLDPLPIVSPPSFGLYKNSDFLTCRCMSLIVAVFWLVLISALIYTQKLISLFGCNLECMCVRHTMHHYCTTDHSVPQAVYRSLVVPCPHPTFS